MSTITHILAFIFGANLGAFAMALIWAARERRGDE